MSLHNPNRLRRHPTRSRGKQETRFLSERPGFVVTSGRIDHQQGSIRLVFEGVSRPVDYLRIFSTTRKSPPVTEGANPDGEKGVNACSARHLQIVDVHRVGGSHDARRVGGRGGESLYQVITGFAAGR